MQSTKEEVETLYGREVWNYKLDKEGTTYAQMLKDELKKQMIYTCKDLVLNAIAIITEEFKHAKRKEKKTCYYSLTLPMPKGRALLTRNDRFDQVLMRVGDLEVSYGEVVLYMQSTKEEVERRKKPVTIL